MKGFSSLARCLSLMLIFNLAGTAAQLQAAPAVQKSDPPPKSFPFPRSNKIEMVPHSSGVVAPANPPEHVEATALYPYSRLTFQSFRNFADWNVYVGNDDGSGQTQLTSDTASDLHPRANRGATRIVFASRRTGNYEIFTMNPDGSGLTQLTFDGADDFQPYWSPDGSKIVFQAYRDGQSEVYVMNADGNGQTRLTANADYDGEPSWSPDGSKIAFVSKRTGGSGDYFVYVMNADGSGQVQLSGQAYSEGPVWSPDGTKIAYDAAGADYWQNLWVMNADGSNQHAVFDEGGWAEAWARSWSPDSRYIAFTRIYFTQCGNNLCWTYAYLDAWDSQTGGVVRLSYNGADWRPDWQTTDAVAPSSSVNALSAQSSSPIVVRWNGTDGGPAGIANYDVQVKDGAGGAWTNWQTSTTATSASYAGVGGHTYYFRARARDNASNLEAYPVNYDATTTVETLAPIGYVQTLPAYSKDSVLVTWNGTDPGGSGIQTYDVQYRDGAGGTWTNWQVGIANASAIFNGTTGHTYYFRARATDRAQNVGTYPANGDTLTTFYAWGIEGGVRDNTGAPVVGAAVNTVPAGPEAFSSDMAGDYAAYVLTAASAYTATWDKAGYGILPATVISGPTDAMVDVVLPPEDDLMVNGHFEAGDLVSNGWQVSGALTPTLTSTVRHTGQQSVLLGTTTLSQTGDSTVAQVVAIPPTATVSTLSFLYWPGRESPLKDGLVVYWNLDEGSGIRLDATGRGNDLSDNNTVTSSAGKVGNAAQFVTVNQEYLSHPDNADLSTGDVDFTVAGWIYLDSKDGHRTIASKWTFDNYEYLLRYDFYTYDRFTFEVSGNGSLGGITIVPANSLGSPTIGQWYWVVGWHDSQDDTLNIQVNNGPVNSLAYSSGMYDGGADLDVGFVPGYYYHNGRLDEVGLWKRVLTAEERSALYNNGLGCTYPFTTCGSVQPNLAPSADGSAIAQAVTLPPTLTTPTLSFVYLPGQESPLKDNLVAYWPLDEVGGTRGDVTERGNDVSDNNTVLSTNGKVGNAAQFVNANQEYLSHMDTDDLSVGNIDFTLAAWVQLASKAYPSRNIVSKWINGGQHEYSLYYNTDADRFRFAISSNGNDYPEVQADASGSPALNAWYFVVAWHDSVNDTLNIQVDNGPVNSIPYASGGRDGAVPFLIGASNNGTLGLMDGLIDEVGFWKRVLTPDERAALYNSGQGCTYPFLTCGPLTTREPALPQIPSLTSQFTVSVDDGVTTTIVFSDSALTALNWTHQWADLSAWAGQTVTITFMVEQGAGAVPARVYLDEVTLGSAKPDVWAMLDVPMLAAPGETFVYQLVYGNQGGTVAAGTYLTLTLPPEFTYSSVSLPPVISTTTQLVWDVGSLAAQSGPLSIFVIASVSPTAPALTTVTSTLTITTTSELETANNTQQVGTFIGYQVLLPVVRRD